MVFEKKKWFKTRENQLKKLEKSQHFSVCVKMKSLQDHSFFSVNSNAVFEKKSNSVFVFYFDSSFFKNNLYLTKIQTKIFSDVEIYSFFAIVSSSEFFTTSVMV